MSAPSLSIFATSVVILLAATAADSSSADDLMNAYKHFQKAKSSSDFYDKKFVPLLNKYKSDIIAHRADDEKKLDEMVQIFLLSLNSCDETLPTILAETLSYRIDLFPDIMKRVPDKQKPEFLHMMQIGVANIEFEVTKPGTPKTDVDRIRKFKAKFKEYQQASHHIK